MRLKGLDLNLLVALDVLLDERSVSRAAERLHLSQPAASAALARLREYFKDDLLVLHGKRMIATAYAESLVPEVKDVLARIDTLISTPAEFDPGRTERVFRLVASDYISAVLLGPAMRFMHRAAPRIQFDIKLPNEQMLAEFDRGDIDLVLTPEEFVLTNHPTELLLEEKHVVVGWDQNPILGPEFSRADFLRSSHIAVTLGSNRQQTYAERYLERSVGKRRVELFVPNFTLVPWLLVGTNRLAVVHERLAHTFAADLPLRIVPLPVDIPPMREMMQFHNARTEDDGLGWLRGLLKRMAHETSSNQPCE